MELNADFTRRAVVRASELPWTASPMPGVERRMLDRVGGEVARATSIVRYAPGSAFSAHVHELGEEYLVLEGTFQDEHGDFPVGSYVRNPPGSKHVPASKDGCTILVKLRQFDPDDRAAVHVDTASAGWAAVTGAEGIETVALHEDARETVALERWAPGAVRSARATGWTSTPSGRAGAGCVLDGGRRDRGVDGRAGTRARRAAGWLLAAGGHRCRRIASRDVATAGPFDGSPSACGSSAGTCATPQVRAAPAAGWSV